jgi:hypothetical protein
VADGYAAVLFAFAADLNHGTVVGAANVADIGVEELVGRQAGE